MTTILYNDFLSAYNADPTTVNNVNWVCETLRDTYIPNPTHKPNDINAYKFITGGSLQGTEFSTNSMGTILDIIKQRFAEKVRTEPQDVIQKLDEWFSSPADQERKNKVIALMSAGQGDYAWWDELVDWFMKYIIVRSPNQQILCFCERIKE